MENMMNYRDAVYLKHAGETIDVKVTIKRIGSDPLIHMRDFEFTSFPRALEFLRHLTEVELHAA